MKSSLEKKSLNLVIAQLTCCAFVFAGPFFEDRFSLENFVVLRTIAGIALLVGLIMLALAAWNLGRSLTPLPIPRTDSVLVTSGLYSISRHPIYTAIFLMSFGWTTLWLSWISLVGSIVLFAVLRKKAKLEEHLLLQRYGQSYADYMRRVGRFLPRLRNGPEQ